ncbi:Hypothetical_protein [Hexamita inflata]|uniref:Hypothetical_protein n=1 Tax=Hexamita inflata TaxID=28002 RepID=A0AA86VPR2_9EUKA|nr:Hypothetical protein HINF_LOCUS60288 [Hexamita inflata]
MIFLSSRRIKWGSQLYDIILQQQYIVIGKLESIRDLLKIKIVEINNFNYLGIVSEAAAETASNKQKYIKQYNHTVYGVLPRRFSCVNYAFTNFSILSIIIQAGWLTLNFGVSIQYLYQSLLLVRNYIFE